ncbi:NADP-dependent phosphogluconate dehydrogenase [Anaerolentibacter hominis]|uniref:NADP-dependent phosphogluconate dehydrogenase n=1 Tax=Anaerolentibacter hominis TaxID=3079009 RepID=UPI0031B83B7F
MATYQLGVLGLGVMGTSLAKNFIGRGFAAALYSKDEGERDRFQCETGSYHVFQNIEEFVNSLEKPRKVIMMITAGRPVDMVLEQLKGYLEPGDIVIDGGNSYYKDTNRRTEYYRSLGLHFVGMGVSGGELGALTGPSMMVGGDETAWKACGGMLKTAAALADGESCCNYVGRDGAGHYVKMVHNGIEYAVMELIAESYYFMKEGMGLSTDKIAGVFKSWKHTELNSYLIDITVTVLEKPDEDGTPLVERIRGVARQKGTGLWTMLESLERGAYIPTIYQAVAMRQFSEHRVVKAERVCGPAGTAASDQDVIDALREALYTSIICCYAQGLNLIKAASDEFGWDINLAASASLWKGGCIIRAKLLKEIVEVFETEPELDNLLFAPSMEPVWKQSENLRKIALLSMEKKICMPAFTASMTYMDACRMGDMPLNLVQGLRDCFGAHTYERTDREGIFHTVWEEIKE